MNEYVSKEEHEEFIKRIEAEHRRLEDEDNRQNNRLKVIEEKIDDMIELTASIKSLTVEIQTMTREIEKMGKRVETLEGRDGDMWRKVVGVLVTASVTALVTFVACQIGLK